MKGASSNFSLRIGEYPHPPFIIRTIFLAKEEKRCYSFSLSFPLFKIEIFQSSVILHRGVKIRGLWIHFNSAMVVIKWCIRFLPFSGFRIWLWLFIFSWAGAGAFYPPVNKWLKLPYKSSPLLIGIRLKIDRFQKRSQGHGMAFQTGCQNKCSPKFHLWNIFWKQSPRYESCFTGYVWSERLFVCIWNIPWANCSCPKRERHIVRVMKRERFE